MVFNFLASGRQSQTSSKQQGPDPFEPTPILRQAYLNPVKLLLYTIYHLINHLRTAPPSARSPARVVCISDTHNHVVQDVPRGNILIHAGDMTDVGSVAEIQKQVDWLASLPHEEIVVISGNHDTYLDPRTRPSLREDERAGSIDWKRVHYLQHRRLSLTINTEENRLDDHQATSRTRLLQDQTGQRRLTLYGAPQIPACGPMDVHAFQYPRGQDAWSETVPQDVDILITHTPPKFHMDLSLPDGLGCEHLARELKRVKPALHVFGHVHWGAGRELVWWDGVYDAFQSGMNRPSGWSHGVLDFRLWLLLVRLIGRGARGLVWDKIWGGHGSYTTLVNAAQVHGNTGNLGNSVQVVDI